MAQASAVWIQVTETGNLFVGKEPGLASGGGTGGKRAYDGAVMLGSPSRGGGSIHKDDTSGVTKCELLNCLRLRCGFDQSPGI
jgi:hypothetical protein